MPSLAQIQFNADQILDGIFPQVTAHQGVFLENRGRFWQGGQTHTVLPTHTQAAWGSAVPDRMNVSVGDNLETWAAAAPTLDQLEMPCAIRCDQYQAANGKGWLLAAAFRFDGVVYARVRNVGPENYRAHEWEESEEFADLP